MRANDCKPHLLCSIQGAVDTKLRGISCGIIQRQPVHICACEPEWLIIEHQLRSCSCYKPAIFRGFDGARGFDGVKRTTLLWQCSAHHTQHNERNYETHDYIIMEPMAFFYPHFLLPVVRHLSIPPLYHQGNFSHMMSYRQHLPLSIEYFRPDE